MARTRAELHPSSDVGGAHRLFRRTAMLVLVGLATYVVSTQRNELLDVVQSSVARATATVARVAGPTERVAPEPAMVSTTTAPAAAPAIEDPWVGVLLSPTIELSARHDARLTKVLVRVGESVRAGDVLAEIDTTQLRHELAAAQASLRASHAETWQASVALAQAKDRRDRRGTVVRYGSVQLPIVSDEELAGARFDSQSASGRVSAASATAEERLARVGQLRAMLDEAALKAPFDGVVATRYLEQGAYARAGAPILRVVSRGALRARFAVPEQDVKKVMLGARVSLAWDDRRIDGGVIDRIAPELDAATAMLFVEASVTNLDSANADPALRGRVIKVRPAATTKPGG